MLLPRTNHNPRNANNKLIHRVVKDAIQTYTAFVGKKATESYTIKSCLAVVLSERENFIIFTRRAFELNPNQTDISNFSAIYMKSLYKVTVHNDNNLKRFRKVVFLLGNCDLRMKQKKI